MVLSAQELLAKMATAGMGNKKIATTLGVPQSTTKRRMQRLRSEGEKVTHNVGRPRGAEARMCLVFFSFFVAHYRAWLFSRQSSQTFAGVWHRSQYFSILSQRRTSGGAWSGAHRRWSALARRRGCIRCAVPRGFHATFSDTPFSVVQFHAFPSQFLRLFGSLRCLLVCVSVLLVASMMLIASCITLNCVDVAVFFFSVFVVDCLLETMRWQADASCSRGAAPQPPSGAAGI